VILPFTVYTHAGQEFEFLFVILSLVVYTLAGQEFDFLFVILPFAVYTYVGKEFDFFFLNEQFRLVLRSMLKQLSSREVALQELAIC